MRLPSLSGSLHFTFLVQPYLQEMQQHFSFESHQAMHSRPAVDIGIGLENDNYALTGCNVGTGVVSTMQVNRKGYGSPVGCLDAHENQHINYESTCCARAKKCYDKTTGNKCFNAYDKWAKANLNDNECKAYNAEVVCLTAALKQGYSAATVKNINKRLAEATQFGQAYCKKAVATACPFDANGNII